MRKKKTKIPERKVEIKNVKITRLSVKVTWEPSCCHLVSLKFSDPDGTLSYKYDIGGKKTVMEPHFTIPFFEGSRAARGRIHASLVALAWICGDDMYLKAEGKLVRVKAEMYPEQECGNIIAIGHITEDRWIDQKELQDIPYPYCLFKSDYL